MEFLYSDIQNSSISYFNKSENKLLSKIDILPLNILNNNTADIFELIINNNKYICKVYNIIVETTKKYMGINEFYFYKNIKKYLEDIISIPRFYYYIKNDKKQNYGIVLEKLTSTFKLNIYDDSEELQLQKINSIIYSISNLHLFYLNKDISNFTEYKNNTDFIIIEKIKGDILIYFDKVKYIFKNDVRNIFSFMLYREKTNIPLNKTLLHGSLKIDNIIFHNDDINNPYFIDWSLFKCAYGIEDILFLIIFSLSHEVFKKNYKNIINDYYNNTINMMNKLKQIGDLNSVEIGSLQKTSEENQIIEKNNFSENIKDSLSDFISNSIIGLYIKNEFVQNKNPYINIFFDNYILLVKDYYPELNIYLEHTF
jgi:hypothetical protein